MKISICMPYYNRRDQLIRTLNSIAASAYSNYEVCIADDCSDTSHRIDDLPGMFPFVKVFRFDEKQGSCPVIPHNKSIAMATGDVVIIQNPECYHNGDILSHVFALMSTAIQMEFSVYIVYGCYSIDELTTLRYLDGSRVRITSIKGHAGERHNNWYQHSEHRPACYNWCVALTRKNLVTRLGGFDESYANGYAYGDDEFIRRVRRSGMHIKQIDTPFVLHQHHDRYPSKGIQSNKMRYEMTENDSIIQIKNRFI